MAQKIIEVDSSQSVESIVKELQLPPRPLLILLGDFNSTLNSQIQRICSRGIAPAALDPGALIVDRASCAGCAAVMGEAARDQDQTPPLLGIVEHNRPATDIDPNHELVLRLPAEWTDTVKYTFQISDQLIKNGSDKPKPVLAMLFGGGDSDKKAVLRCALRNWPVLVVKGTGGLADQIMDAITPQRDGTLPPVPGDPDLREIVETTTLYPFPVDGSMDDLNRVLMSHIDTHTAETAETLKETWARFDELDRAAMSKQSLFRRLEMALILLAVLAAFVAILTSPTAIPFSFRIWMHKRGLPAGALHLMVILTPIAISILGTYNSHFRDGNKWILLRGAAEGMKREIFRFRAQAGIYSDQQCTQMSRESKLADKVKDITAALEQSEVNKTSIALVPATTAKKETGPANLRHEEIETERLTMLAPEEYLTVRIENQIDFLAKKTRGLSKQLIWMQIGIYVVGGLGTLLAAIRRDVWVALASAIATALTTKLQTDQVESSLTQYNQALTSLRNIQSWWRALSRWEKARQRNIDVLVDQTERTLETETAGWVQQMQSALDKLTEKEPSTRTQ